jgi:hypothetical protein
VDGGEGGDPELRAIVSVVAVTINTLPDIFYIFALVVTFAWLPVASFDLAFFKRCAFAFLLNLPVRLVLVVLLVRSALMAAVIVLLVLSNRVLVGHGYVQ